jgi:hypothetical protein
VIQIAPEKLDRLNCFDAQAFQMMLFFGQRYWRSAGAQSLAISSER